MATHLLPPKVLQRQIRYLLRGLFKPWEYKIRKFICWVNEMVDYLEDLLPFGRNQGLAEYNILELVEFALLREFQEQLLRQDFYPSSKSLNNIVEFCERLYITEEIFNERGDGSHPPKKPIIPVQATHKVLLSGKGPYQAAKPSEEDAKTKFKNKSNSKIICPLRVPVNDMNFCKVMYV